MAAAREERLQGGVRHLSGQDAIFLYGETQSMLMHSVGVQILDPSTAPSGEFGYEQIVETMSSRLHLMPPYRQRVLEVPLGLGRPVLADDPDFRIENHVHRIALPSPGTLRELADFVADFAGRPLERSRPLWEMWVVEGLQGGRMAVVASMHHCMMDGATGSSQMGGMYDLEPDAPPPEAPPWRPAPLPSRLRLAREALGSRWSSPLAAGRLALNTTKGLWNRWSEGREMARHGEPAPPLFPQAPRTLFNRAITPHRAVAFGSAPLADVKFVKNAFGVTVNDAVLAACALALRRYLSDHDDLPDEPLVCGVPVSVKSEREKQEFSNKVSLMLVRLPTQFEEPEEVIQSIHRETRGAKRIFEAIEDDLMPGWLDLVSPVLLTLGMRLYSDLDLADRVPTPVNLVISNMMGPPVPLYCAGARIEAVFPMGPVGEGVGLNLTVLSNMGRLDFGVMACRDIVPDVWDLAEGFGRAVEELRGVAEKRAGDAHAGPGV